MIDQFDPILGILALVGTISAAWGGSRMASRGAKERLDELGVELKEHIDSDHSVQLETVQRLTRIETKIDRYLNGRGGNGKMTS